MACICNSQDTAHNAITEYCPSQENNPFSCVCALKGNEDLTSITFQFWQLANTALTDYLSNNLLFI